MLKQIKGLHHVTSLAKDARVNNAFFTDALGLRRVKKTVNFDNPEVYHLYYGDAVGSPGTVMTHFPFPDAARGTAGTGTVGITSFSVPRGSLGQWAERLVAHGIDDVQLDTIFGDARLTFTAPEGDSFALIETDDDRTPWSGIDPDIAIRGFHSAQMQLADVGATDELLLFMGYEVREVRDGVTRYGVPDGNAASIIDVAQTPETRARQGAGSVHHIAFAVENRARQLEVREALLDTGYNVTPVIDRDYFHAIYFRTPGGVLFEIATNEPGFDRDEAVDHLGESLRLPSQHEHLRASLVKKLAPLD